MTDQIKKLPEGKSDKEIAQNGGDQTEDKVERLQVLSHIEDFSNINDAKKQTGADDRRQEDFYQGSGEKPSLSRTNCF